MPGRQPELENLLNTFFKSESDRGGGWRYVRAYARDAGIEPITACQRVLKRICDAIALILDTAEDLAGEGTATGADLVTA